MAPEQSIRAPSAPEGPISRIVLTGAVSFGGQSGGKVEGSRVRAPAHRKREVIFFFCVCMRACVQAGGRADARLVAEWM